MKTPNLTVRGLLKWLRSKKKNRTYIYIDNCGCLIAQFVKSQGFRNVKVFPGRVYVGEKDFEVPRPLESISIKEPNDFHSARKRAAAFLRAAH